jgi:DNA-binding SARP family transcriptional activator/transcriptional regulator with XRE-family HTH domain
MSSAFSFGSMVREYRRESGLTQRELAAKAGLSLATLRDFEQGRRHRPRQNSLTALADALALNHRQAAALARAAALPRLPADQPLPPSQARGGGPEPSSGAARSGQGFWLSVLGPLEAWYDGVPRPIGPPARRAVLGLLLLDPGALVRRDTIIQVLWGDALPRTAVGLVQAHVSRIRRLMGSGNRPESRRGVIDSVGVAYRLSLSAEELDLLAFRELAARAAAMRTAGDDLAAVELYRRAFSMWRGEPLADVDALAGHPGVTALRQELSDVLLRYAEVACEAGQPYSVLPRLQALVDVEPLNEAAHARLMIALASSGRQAAAIGVYEDIRLRLDRDLGLYPGGELSEAYMRVLRQDIQQGSWEGRPSAHQCCLRPCAWCQDNRPLHRGASPGASSGCTCCPSGLTQVPSSWATW